MISPSLWMIVEYLLTAPLSAALTVCILHHKYGVLKYRQILTGCILGVGMLVSIMKGLDAVLSMFPLFAPLYLFSLWCSGYFAVECVKKRESGELRTGDVLWAVGTYFGFLPVVFFVTPVIRWCEGCMEWH